MTLHLRNCLSTSSSHKLFTKFWQRQIQAAYLSNASNVEEELGSIIRDVEEVDKPLGYKDKYFLASNHPGKVLSKVPLPDNLIKAAEAELKDALMKDLRKKADRLERHLRGRHPPPSDSVARELAQKYEEKFRKSSVNIEYLSEEEQIKYENDIVQKVMGKLKKRMYHWEPLKFSEESSRAYLLARLAPNYSSLVRIFTELRSRDPCFSPDTILDYGSGIGSTYWAASNVWNLQSIFEFVNIEASTIMSQLALRLLETGYKDDLDRLKRVSFRQFLPNTHLTKFQLVVSGHSMFELPSTEDRLNTALNLWKKTDNYLVLCEQGTKSGHRILMEIRSFLLDATKDLPDTEKGYVFSPCPHQVSCPRVEADDGTPCNFPVKYQSLLYNEYLTETLSYVVLRKGVPQNSEDLSWPRIVRDLQHKRGHSHCQVCTGEGTLQKWTFTKGKHGESGLYHIARKSDWGDRLPIELAKEEQEDETPV
ncbi:ribosome assembly protein METTL17, mitochondrial-like [Artemia franciscana]|uniref:Methyltransferase-like protein 17, mitochondrial n=1 Tax=Artemia franciscana TaxID=6661 RepID=A0AA88HYT4_ARTSF|nr:hypothetical protein QYM36_006491 [Artemia franciscana]